MTIVRFVDSKIRDEDQIQILGDELYSLVDDDNKKSLLLNFDWCRYHVERRALGKLIRLDKKVKKAERRAETCAGFLRTSTKCFRSLS